jgi:hypothetical protein
VVDASVAQASVSQSPADVWSWWWLLSVSGRLCGLLEHVGDGLVVRLGGGGAILFILSDVCPVVGRVVIFV